MKNFNPTIINFLNVLTKDKERLNQLSSSAKKFLGNTNKIYKKKKILVEYLFLNRPGSRIQKNKHHKLNGETEILYSIFIPKEDGSGEFKFHLKNINEEELWIEKHLITWGLDTQEKINKKSKMHLPQGEQWIEQIKDALSAIRWESIEENSENDNEVIPLKKEEVYELLSDEEKEKAKKLLEFYQKAEKAGQLLSDACKLEKDEDIQAKEAEASNLMWYKITLDNDPTWVTVEEEKRSEAFELPLNYLVVFEKIPRDVEYRDISFYKRNGQNYMSITWLDDMCEKKI